MENNQERQGKNEVLNTDRRQFQSQEDEIDLLELAQVLLERWWILFLAAVIGAGLAFFGTKQFITPTYKSEAMIYISTKSTSVISLTDLQIGSQMAVDFQMIGTTREVIEEVISELNLDISYDAMLDYVSITNPSSSHILTITAITPDANLSADIANTLANVLRLRIADVMNTETPSSVEQAVPAAKKYSPSTLKNTAIGGMLGLCIAAAILILIHLLDDTIKSEEDVEKYLKVNTLAAIPVSRTVSKKKKKA